MSASLTFSGVSRSFGRLRVLRELSGRVGDGGVLLVRGRNGSGKSTLLRCLAGLMAPDTGAIHYREGDRTFDIAERRRRTGYVAPDLALYEELSVLENLEFFARLRGLPAQNARSWTDRVALPPGRLAGALSSGMRQRLRWAWALLGQPSMLLLDEPFQNLDSEGELLVRALLTEHLRRGFAVVASPTDLDLPEVGERLDLG